MKLTPKQELFIELYTTNFNATESYKGAGYKASNDNIAGVEAHKLLRNPKIKERIDNLVSERAKNNGITAEYVLRGIKGIADDIEAKHNDKLKAFELLGKHLKLFTEKIESENTNNNFNKDITEMTDVELEEELKKYE